MVEPSSSPIPITVNSMTIPLTPFYLYFRQYIAKYNNLDDDEIDQILQIPKLNLPKENRRIYFFGFCETVHKKWNNIHSNTESIFHQQFTQLFDHFSSKKTKYLSQTSNNYNENKESTMVSNTKCGLNLCQDDFANVCEFLHAKDMVNLALTRNIFNTYHNTLIKTMIDSNQFCQYFRRKGVEPRLSLLLCENLSPDLKLFKDSLDIKIIVDFKLLDAQPGGNTDIYIKRQVSLLSNDLKKAKIFKSFIHDYDDTIYGDDVIVSVEREENLLTTFIQSINNVIALTKPSLPLIFKPKLTHQYIFTCRDVCEYDDPNEYSQIEISVYNGSEKVFDFVRLSVILEEFNVFPIQDSKCASDLIAHSFSFCNVSKEPKQDYTSTEEEVSSLESLNNVSTCSTTTADDEDEEIEIYHRRNYTDSFDFSVAMEVENKKMWKKFLPSLII